MSDTYNENATARLKNLAALSTRVKTELDTLDGTALESIDLPEEIFRD